MNALQLLSNIPTGEATEAAAESSITFSGPSVFAEFELFGMVLRLNESVAVQWVMMIIIGSLFFILGRNLKVKPDTKRQALAEMVVGLFSGMVRDNMGVKYNKYTPYIATLFCYSSVLSLATVIGLRPPTADVSVIAAWGILTFVLTQYNRFKTTIKSKNAFGCVKHYINPLNLISEISNPVSQTFRHYGNILAGVIIGGLVYWALGYFAVIAPAILSAYFDIALGFLQAFVFATLTMVYVAMAEINPKATKE